MEGKRKQKNLFIYGLVAFITVVGFAILIAGIVQTQKKTPCTLASSATTRDSTNSSATTGVSSNSSATTEDSTKLINFMKKVQKSYYRLNANNYVYMPDVDKTRIKEEFRPYDPSPMAIKRQTDTALALLAEINGMNLNMKKLRPRERKAVAQVKHFLQSIFGQPYEANYYAGDWLLGPNYFCWQPICYIGYDLNSHLQPKVFQPKTKKDLEFIVSSLKQHGQAIDQYVKNIQSGVKAGFVRSVEDCESGTYSIISKFPQVSRKNETGK